MKIEGINSRSLTGQVAELANKVAVIEGNLCPEVTLQTGTFTAQQMDSMGFNQDVLNGLYCGRIGRVYANAETVYIVTNATEGGINLFSGSIITGGTEYMIVENGDDTYRITKRTS